MVGTENRGERVGRRSFLKASLGGIAFLLTAPARGMAFFLSQFQTRTVEKEDFSFDPRTGMVEGKGKRPEPYQLRVGGLVEHPVKFSYPELRGLPRFVQVSDFHCVEGWSVEDARWGGVRFEEICRRVKIKAGAEYVIFHALGETASRPEGQKNYLESFPLKKLLDPREEILLALDLDEKPLTQERGAPLRVVAPYQMGYKSIKFVTAIEFSSSQKAGWWSLGNSGYPIDAPVQPGRLRKKKG
jgi:DMSO/TMAO reductase YedYZ molybdopterin-dependent catalytic subunit